MRFIVTVCRCFIPPCRQQDDCRDVEACGTCSVTGQSPVPTSFSLRQISSSSRFWCLDSVHQRKSCEGVDEETLLEPSQLIADNKNNWSLLRLTICIWISMNLHITYKETNGILLVPLSDLSEVQKTHKHNHAFSLTVELGTSASFWFNAGF